MITAVVAMLKTGTVKNVVPFGSLLPGPPYAVVKEERGLTGRRFRIIAHMAAGQQIMLDDYVRAELLTLLDGVSLISRHGAHNTLAIEDEADGLVVSNDDGTISMERCFLLPSKVF